MEFKMPIAAATAVIKNYYSYGEFSLVKGVPIEYLESIRAAVKVENPGRRIRIRFRGPRNLPVDRRSRMLRQSQCVKQFAKTFAVYVD